MKLETLREQLNALDRELLDLAARRQALATEIARVKGESGLPTRDFGREREVLMRARAHATELGLPPGLADALLRPLIHASLATQEQARVSAQGQGTGQRALVIGGRGKMGRWFVEFLASQGFAVEIADPAGPAAGFAYRPEWQQGPLDHDLIVLATPLGTTASVLDRAGWCSTSVHSRRRCEPGSRLWSRPACA
jgi:chorismate mutase/prephenate dehydrogenase